MAKRSYDSWFGVGIKGGGILGLGAEYVTGKLMNAGLPQERHSFQMLSLRAGPGLGGSAGLVICMVFNCMNLQSMHGKTQEDWGVNVSMGEKWSSIASAAKNYKVFEIARRAGKSMRLGMHDIEHVRNFLHLTYNAYDGFTTEPKMLVIDVPGAGVGYELSANLTIGTMEILS